MGHRVITVAVLCVVAQCVWAASSADLLRRAHIHTAIAGDYFSSDRLLDNKIGFYGLTGWFSARPRVARHTHAYVALRLTDPNITQTGAVANVLEAYMAHDWRHGDIRIGKQIAAWGRANGVNPTDNLTPRNYTVLLPSTADQRFGTPSLVWNQYLSSRYTLTTFVTSDFTPSVIPVPLLPGVIFVSQVPPAALSDTEGALKLSYSGGAGDWSISAFRGFNLLPNLVLGYAQDSVDLHYNPIEVFGADGDRPLGDHWLGWFEGAYSRPLGLSYALAATQKPNLFVVGGLGRTFRGTLNLSFQVVYRRVYGYLSPLTAPAGPLQEIAVENSLINGAWARNDYGMTFQAMDNWRHQTIQGKVFEYVNVDPVNTYTRFTLTYEASDHVTETIGAEDYNGPTASNFGQLARNRTLFGQWRYGFS